MDLKELSKYPPLLKKLMSWMLLRDKQYQTDVEKGLPFFAETELIKIENDEKYKSGLLFEEVNQILTEKGMILKLPTFKKYINLKLIPVSIGRKIVGRGSKGLYPSSVIREINFIKYALYSNLNFTKAVQRFRTSFLEIIETSFPDPIDVMDFSTVCGNTNESDEWPGEAISRISHELFDKKVIAEKKKDEILELVNKVSDSIIEAKEKFHNLMELIRIIEVTGVVGFTMLVVTEDE